MRVLYVQNMALSKSPNDKSDPAACVYQAIKVKTSTNFLKFGTVIALIRGSCLLLTSHYH